MTVRSNFLRSVCEAVVSDSARSLRAQRLSRRHEKLAAPQILTPEQAELYDINSLLWSVVEDALPLCQAQGVHVDLHQDPRVPAVPILLQPLEDALAAGIEECLDATTTTLVVRSFVTGSRAVITMEGRDAAWIDESGATTMDPAIWIGELGWHVNGLGNRVELLVGEKTLQALGGRLLLQRNATAARLFVELPTTERPWQRSCDALAGARTKRRRNALPRFPGIESIPLQMS